MKKIYTKFYCSFILFTIFNLLQILGQAQPASVSVPVSIGRTSCGSGTRGVREYNYNATSNVLSNFGAICAPNLAAPGFSTNLTGDAFNPKDTSLYIVRTIYSGVTPTTYVWKYKMPGCPGSSLALSNTFPNWDIAGLVFDRNGNGFWVEFLGATAPYTLGLRKVDFATNTIGNFDTLNLSGFTINQLNGDVALTPKGVMFASFDTTMFTIDYSAYDGLPGKINTTFVGNVKRPTGASLIGLCYADGKMVGSYNNCLYREINLLTGDTSVITYAGGVLAYDLTSITSSLGLAKFLASSSPTGTPGEYDLDYNITIQNLGNHSLDNITVSDNLQTVFGAGNVTVTSVSYVKNPGTLFLNPAYNGTTVTNLFLNTPSVSRLKNFPSTQSTCIISIKCRVRNIVPGVTYNNNAVGTATGYRGVALSEISTNGDNPDLNTNDKADDPGEAQPTPFIINTAPETPPCLALSTILYNQNFGTGTGIISALPGTVRTQYAPFGGIIPILDERYAITDTASKGNPARWSIITDHTGGLNGRMMVVNADVLGNKIFFDTVNVNCGNLKYSFFAWTSFLGNNAYQTFCNGVGGYKFAKLIFLVRNATTGTIISNSITPNISSNSWQQYGLKWVMPAGVTRVVLEIYNAGQGGCGNDVAIDDVQFGMCDPQPSVSAPAVSSGCIGGSTTFTGVITDTVGMSSILVYQWQSSLDNSFWTDIGGANSISYTINPITLLDGRYYRLIVSTIGNLGNPSCRYTSNGFLLSLKIPSTTPLNAVAAKNNICPGDAVNLRATAGILGTNASLNWYTGSCGGTLVGTGANITVNPLITTTYYVRAEGDCNTTACRPVTVVINCDIDDDDDGIPDITENNGLDVEADDDFDGIPNWRDVNIPGFTDANSDGVDDRYDFDLDGIINQFDRDSDNDGIPDTMEATGVDADGDGRIDGFSDTDADGFSQNVDANTTGHLTSGAGLNRLDFDGDGLPNFQDLDSDGDGIPDIIEAGGVDANNNGRVDVFTDPDGDGYTNTYDTDVDNNGTIDNAFALIRTGTDSNNDGRADSYPNKNQDKDGRSNPYDLDSDGDGLSDVLEIRLGQLKISGSSSFTDANNDGFADGVNNTRGWNNTISLLAALNLPNNDTDTRPDYLDMDADGDGATDNIEIQTTFLPGANYTLPGGVDADNDGLDDTYDNFPGQFRGGRINPVDTDSDGTPDYLDLDTDNDSQPDRLECNDNNFNRIADDNTTPTGLDTDGDGLDNRFDNDNTNHNVSSGNLATGGGTGGPAPAGTLTMVTKSYGIQADRDWRYNGMILNVNLLSFNGNLYNQTAHLNWSFIANESIAKFIVERSFDGVSFSIIAELPGTNSSTNQQTKMYDDILNSPVPATIYYRIKFIGADGKSKYTGVILLKPISNGGNTIKVMPSPATSFFNLTIRSATNTTAYIEMIDGNGKIVLKKEEKVQKGTNAVLFQNLHLYPAGIYSIKVRLNEEILKSRLLIQK